MTTDEIIKRFMRNATYPVSTDIRPEGYGWHGRERLDYALDELRADLTALEDAANLRDRFAQTVFDSNIQVVMKAANPTNAAEWLARLSYTAANAMMKARAEQ